MNREIRNHPRTLILLIVLLILLGLGGIGGGIALLADPSGAFLRMPVDLLKGLPISSFILPGLFLVVIMGVAPLLIAWGLWKGLPWAWIAAIVQSIVLILWIGFQIFLWRDPIAIQVVYLVWGIFMLGLCFARGVKSDKRRTL